MVDFVVECGDLTSFLVDAIVNPSNSHGFMGGGVAYAIKKRGGQVIEDEAVSKAPIPVGDAVETTGGFLDATYVIHASTMREPAERISLDNVVLATKAALLKASELGVSSLAFPGMGCGVGGVSYSDAACAMVSAIIGFNPSFRIFLIGFDDDLTGEFRIWVKRLNQQTG